MARSARTPWAQVLTLGDQRFGILVGGPFDGRCYPLRGTPVSLLVPAPVVGADPVRYVLRDGYYRFQEVATPARSAA
jgi:hypothetical protein